MAEPIKANAEHSSSQAILSAEFEGEPQGLSSNVQVVSPDKLATDVAHGKRKRRFIILLITSIILMLLVGFGFIGRYYYQMVYSAPKVFASECFELSLPANYTKQTGLAQGAEYQKISEPCVVDQAKQGSGGVIASSTKKPIDTSRMSLHEYTNKIDDLFEGVISKQIATNGRQVSNEMSTLDGAVAHKIVTEQDIGDKQKVIMHHYFGVRNGKLFIIGWFYNPIDRVAKADIEKSIESFRWK